jgi:FkbM family methyltransferase
MRKVIGRLVLWYLRHVPVERKKYLLERYFDKFLPPRDLQTAYTNPDGVTFWIDNRDYVMNKIFLRGVYERNTLRTIRPLLNDRKGIAIDCGANIGLYSLYLSKFAPGLEVHAFEPLSRNQELFRRNMELNGVTSVKLNPFGLSNADREIDIFIVDENNFGRTSEFSMNEGERSETIRLKTLDGYCEENGIETLSFIKVDIEGAEMDFIKGGEQIIRRSPDLVMVVEINECAYAANYTPEDLFRYIVGLGFDAYVERDYPFGKKRITDNSHYRGNILFTRN